MAEDAARRGAPPVAGRIGVTLLCVYLLAVTARIGGCYHPDLAVRDELAGRGPAVGAPFPAFELPDVSGARISSRTLAGKTVVLAFVPSLDWSPPTKARLLDLAVAFAGRRDAAVAVIMTEAQATPRALAFAREHPTPFYYLVDGGGLITALGLDGKGPDGTAAALPATFVLDAGGVVRLRDVRRDARTWIAPEVLVATLGERAVTRDGGDPAARVAARDDGFGTSSAPISVSAIGLCARFGYTTAMATMMRRGRSLRCA